ncbi:hypothetical protein ETAA8_36230 [Anatilimnocola aggregata]|uniref:Uncharacterized protein n=1 Tax=Anatilimnocola aggregata TaxID=2528021 RepID=A0A517YE77_9BACT|nr:hypothetical protein ETAA8_36230 [Anatilimnocola aggregata]
MEQNPYESPQPSSDPPLEATPSLFRDTLNLLFCGAVLYVPIALAVIMAASAFDALSYRGIRRLELLLAILCCFLLARIYWRFRNHLSKRMP